jgi:hypothetical protein
MALRDYFIAPPEESDAAGEPGRAGADPARERAAAPATPPAPGHLLRRLVHGAAPRRGQPAAAAALAPSLGVLANPRDLAAVGIAAGHVLARRSPAAVVILHAPGAALPQPAVRAPARPAAARLAASLRARGLTADARGRLAIVDLTAEDVDPASAAARALAAASALSTVLALAVRDPDLDAHLAGQDAILVALPPSTDPALAELTAASAARLARRAASTTLSLDPLSRTLALAALRAPGPVRTAVEGLVG